MTADELRSLHRAGFELGAHTVSHPDLSTLPEEDCYREIALSAAAVEALTGAPVRTFAYPFCNYGPAALAAVRRAGLLAAVTCGGHGDWTPHTMKRAIVTGRDGMPSFVAKLWDVYHPARDSIPGRAARVATRGLRRRIRSAREDRRG